MTKKPTFDPGSFCLLFSDPAWSVILHVQQDRTLVNPFLKQFI